MHLWVLLCFYLIGKRNLGGISGVLGPPSRLTVKITEGSTQMKGRFPEKIGGQLFLFFFFSFFFSFFFFFFVFLALFGLFISFLFSFNLLERLKRSAFQRRPRMIPCLLAAAAMVMRYGRLCAENESEYVHFESEHVHFELCCPYTLPAWSCVRRQVPQTPHGTP